MRGRKRKEKPTEPEGTNGPIFREVEADAAAGEMLAMFKDAGDKDENATRLEAELADRMVNHMAAELATDIKQILGVKERREMLRGLARDHMDAVMKAGT